MGTITMSGYNNIDWNSVLTAVMTQEAQPLSTMKSQYGVLSTRKTAFATLASKLSAMESAAADLKNSTGFSGRKANSTDATTVAISASGTAMVGTYDVVVSSLARAQVTTSATTASARTTVVATGGTLTINGEDVVLEGETTLEGLANAINGTADTGVTATIVSATVGGVKQYRMVLTGTESGLEHAFSVGNALTGTVGNVEGGSRFDFSATPVVAASDADITVNGVQSTNDTNSFTDVIPGTTLKVLKESSTVTVLTVEKDSSDLKTKLQTFVQSYNTLRGFFSSQDESAKSGNTGTLSRDALSRSLRTELSTAILASLNGTGSYQNLAEVGVEFKRDGTLSLNESVFDDAIAANAADVESLLAGGSDSTGTFDAIASAIGQYTSAGGLVPDARTRLDEQMSALSNQMLQVEERLAMRRLALQKEYAAADSAIAALNSQTGSLSNLSSGYRLY
jgi:flagellar hook-associated protein 2